MDPITELPFLQWLEQTVEAVSIDAAGKLVEQPQTKQNDALIQALQNKIADLERRLIGYINSQSLSDLFSGPSREIVMVKKSSGSDKQGKQQIPSTGVLEDFVGGLNVTSDTAPEALITLPADTVCVLRAFDADGKTLRNIIISGSASESVGQYQFQVHCMPSQNASGWDGVRAAPELPPP